jgi:integrase/recombinase XerD
VGRGERGTQLTAVRPVPIDTAVRRYLDHLTVERGLAEHTLQAYRSDLRRYSAALDAAGRTGIGEVTTLDVAGFLAGLRQGGHGHPPLAASSAGRAVVAVRGLHAFAAAEGLAPSDPARQVRPPVPPRRLPRALPVADVERLLDAAGTGSGPRPLRDRALLELLYATGARISEATALDIDDLDLLSGPASARQADDDQAGSGGPERLPALPAAVRLSGKGGKQRIVPVGSYARQALDQYLVRARPALAAAARTASASPAVFLNARGGRLTRQGAWGALRAAAGRAGIDLVSPHTLRHCFATHLLDGGADVRVVQELLGHASVSTTQVYTLVTADKLREVYASAHPRALG